jgi:hypothetical protein
MRPATRLYLHVVGFGLLLFLGGCGEPVDTPGAAQTTQDETMSTASGVGSSTTSSTFPIEVVLTAEANGTSLEEAAAILHGQGLQSG